MRVLILTIGMFFMVMGINAQSVERQFICSSGSASGSNTAYLTSTIGEAVIGTINNSSTTLTQGFQQSIDESTGVIEIEALQSSIIYPNPVNNQLFVRFGDAQVLSHITFQIVSLYGDVVLVENGLNSFSIQTNTISLDVSELAKASYILRIVDSSTGQSNNVIFIKAN
jgi:hypothetical protein